MQFLKWPEPNDLVRAGIVIHFYVKFYIKVYYNQVSNAISRFHPFKSLHKLVPYLEQIDLEIPD